MGIAIAITLLSWASVAWGVLEMRGNDWQETTASGLKIGLALLPALLAPFMVLNFWWAVRIVEELCAGKNVLARWRMSGEALAAFIAEDKARSAHGTAYLNDWIPPYEPPADGIEVIFGPTGVWVDNSYFTLAKSGFYKFTAVGILPSQPLCIEFVTVATMVSNISAVTIRRFTAVLPLPLTDADSPDALKVLDHYRGVLSGETNPNPQFYPRRIRIGLIGAAVFLLPAFAGYIIGPQSEDYFDLPSLMMIFGSIFGLASLLLAMLAWILMQRQQKRG
jgi:hypothetical protein